MLAWIAACLGLVFGLGLLTKSADWFVDGAASLAKRWRMPPLLIGFLIVGFGTSTPEMAVSALASAQGSPMLALGNAYGSNIANIFLILGVSALIAPLAIHRIVYRRDLPMLLLAVGATLLLSANGAFSRMDGCILLVIFCLYVAYQLWSAIRQPAPALDPDEALQPLGKSCFKTIAGLICLLGASEILVLSAKWIAVKIALAIGIDEHTTDLVVGLTVVAVGTSLPELMSSVAAMRRGESDIAVGNVVGSNFFNTLVVVGIALSIHGVPTSEMPASLRVRDLGVMTGATILLELLCLVAVMRARRAKAAQVTLGRVFGGCFVLCFVLYTALVIIACK